MKLINSLNIFLTIFIHSAPNPKTALVDFRQISTCLNLAKKLGTFHSTALTVASCKPTIFLCKPRLTWFMPKSEKIDKKLILNN